MSHTSWIANNTIMLGVAGSHSQGTSTPTSDLDVRGICIMPLVRRLSYRNKFEQHNADVPELRKPDEDPWEDVVIYDIAKAIRLMAGSNPNMLQLLFLPEYKISLPTWQMFVEKRDLFLSNKCLPRFMGYAKRHLDQMNTSDGSSSTRIGKRKEIELLYGYDTKNAMHLIRLMRMCYELVTTGRLNVYRKDAEELLEIRNGKWSYSRIIEESEKLEYKTKSAISVLQDDVNHTEIDCLLYRAITNWPIDKLGTERSL